MGAIKMVAVVTSAAVGGAVIVQVKCCAHLLHAMLEQYALYATADPS